MDCKPLNEVVENKILEFLENKAPAYTERSTLEINGNPKYSPATLLNEWYEDRLKTTYEPPQAPMLSEYMDHYRQLCKFPPFDRKVYFNMMFDSQGVGQELLMDHLGFAYYKNYVTTYDLCYNHLVKGLCGPFPRKYIKGRYVPETDLTKIYGNLTQWGIKEHKLPKPSVICLEKVFTTETSDNFIAYDRAEIKRLNDFPHRPRKTTDVTGNVQNV